MPAASLADARDLDPYIERLFSAAPGQRAEMVRRLFVERLDFHPASGDIALAPAALDGAAPPARGAYRVAHREGVEVVFVQFAAAGRLTARALAAALKEVKRTLADVLLVAADASGAQWQFVYPTVRAGREMLRRLAVQQGQPRRTVVEQLGGIYDSAPRDGLRVALEKAYDVEAVTDRFFDQYRRVFEAVMAQVSGLPDPEERRMFCQALFNRLMFLYFLQRKGWLSFGGDANYLHALWASHKRDSDGGPSFYTTRLRLLFFTALNNSRSADFDRAQDIAAVLIGRVPFLNGGLFAEGELDKLDGVDVPDAAIAMILDQLFARFNFTITESTPYDVEVAVDPEMLGKVFEELVTGRHESGSYYTPRPVVAFMCREALKGYLTARIEGLSAPAAAELVDEQSVAHLSVAQAHAVLDALAKITVVDPACGSGAYLLGLLHELVDLQRLIYSSTLVDSARKLYELKLRVIARNVYGVDIDPFAVNIAMLRLWLSLVVEYEDAGDPPPLPNLDYKIACGDSLTAPAPRAFQQLSFGHDLIVPFRETKRQYVAAHGEEKLALRAQIEQLRKDIALLPRSDSGAVVGFDWALEFAEVFEDGGFDIVLANPPYLRMELFKDKKPTLKRNFPEVHAERADLYVYFFQRANELLRANGVATFISSNKWLRAGYGLPLRTYLNAHAFMRLVLDFGDLPVFKTATTYPAVFVWQKTSRADGTTCFANVEDLDALYAEGITHYVSRVGEELPAAQFEGANWSLVTINEDAIRRKMEYGATSLGEVVDNKLCWGIKTGCNDAFWIDEPTRHRLIVQDARSAEVIKPLLVGDDIRRYELHARGQYIIYLPHGIDIRQYPAIRDHLLPYRARLEARATTQPWYELQQPQEAYIPFFEGPKIIYPDISQTSRFALCQGGTYFTNTAYGMPVSDLCLLAVLNSRLTWWFLRGVSPAIQGESLRLFSEYMTTLPIPEFADSASPALSTLVLMCNDKYAQRRSLVESFIHRLADNGLNVGAPSSRNPLEQPWTISDEAAFLKRVGARGDSARNLALDILQCARSETAELTKQGLDCERQIDRLVYDLYGLTASEIAIVEGTRADVDDAQALPV